MHENDQFENSCQFPNKISDPPKTEEIRDIIDKMPHTFARSITFIVLGIVTLLFFFGYIIKYPDVVIGGLSVSSTQAPLDLVSEKSGRLIINNIQSQNEIFPNQLLAWIDNPAQPNKVKNITDITDSIDFSNFYAKKLYDKFPKNLNLGDLTVPYSSFLSALKQLSDYQEFHLYDKHDHSLKKVLNEQEIALNTLKEKENLSQENLKLLDKFLERDSFLLKKKIISDYEFEQTLASRISAEDQWKSSLRNSGAIREQISNTENEIQQNLIIKSEKKLQLDLEFLSTYNNLIDKINIWKKEYLITSPIAGKVQFLKFWQNNQFIQAGEHLFSIVPKENSLVGKIILPVKGAGKVKVGQDVIVKLDDYPYLEYGYIKAKVQNIALVSSQINTGDGKWTDSYLVAIIFPDGMVTNYGTSLSFKFESKGTAEIITKDRRLIERFFDNLKYISH